MSSAHDTSPGPSPAPAPALVDENAYGLVVLFHTMEDEEYSLDRVTFLERVHAFRQGVLAHFRERPPATPLLRVDLGHGVYAEWSEGDEAEDPIRWCNELRRSLGAAGFATVVGLTHGGRWVRAMEGAAPPADGDRVLRMAAAVPTLQADDHGVVLAWPGASEALRKALLLDGATREDDEAAGWGAGLYLDAEAVEALGRAPKNAPTPLTVAAATFYRAGR